MRVLSGLSVVAVLAGLTGPAAAQLWPNGGGPSTDVLRNSIDQFQRLAPPPIEAERVATLALPPVESRVDVGVPVLALPDTAPARPAVRTERRAERRATQRRTTRVAEAAPRRSVRATDDGRLERELETLQRRVDDLQRQLDTERARQAPAPQRSSGLPSFNPISPAAAATLPPVGVPPAPTATLR
ncbi:hypothetical protein ACE7GA_07890 [Roseomonas sp. CCTCC AB2023176]|uniref:hypothetical protein n=1 Tax=Roseomonas sp. CCTCC AB2023176 TaxID=3342640 RepID=UPI0035E33687